METGRELLLENLKEWVKPTEKGVYFRPFVMGENRSNFDIFVVGINPASPINESEMMIDEYASLLLNGAEFYKKYKEIRTAKGKTRTSRTRVGMTHFVEELKRRTGKTVLETNVIPYPTESIRGLKQTSDFTIRRANEIFYRVLTDYTPEVIIVHSKLSLKYLVELLDRKGILDSSGLDLNQPIAKLEREQASPFIELEYPSGKQGAIFVCRHLMYYGKKGDSFREFSKKVVQYIQRNNASITRNTTN